jgi:hypothetical protein
VRRQLCLLILALAGTAPGRGAEDLGRYSQVAIDPASTSLFIATVTMSFQPFVRHRSIFTSTYFARVFPYIFISERGNIWITLPDEALLRVSRGEAVDFTGRGLSDSGDERKVEGRATPTGPYAGKIKVRVFVSRRIVLTFNTSYELGAAPAAVTPTRTR